MSLTPSTPAPQGQELVDPKGASKVIVQEMAKSASVDRSVSLVDWLMFFSIQMI